MPQNSTIQKKLRNAKNIIRYTIKMVFRKEKMNIHLNSNLAGWAANSIRILTLCH